MLEARLAKLHTAWASSAPAPDFTSLALVVGDAYADQPDNLRSVAIAQYLLGVPTAPTNIAFLLEYGGATSSLKASYCVGEGSNVALPPAIAATTPPLEQSEFAAKLKDVIGSSGASVRTCSKELQLQQGAFHGALAPLLTRVDDAAPFAGSLLFVKDDSGLDSTTKASSLATAVFRRVVQPELEQAVVKQQTVPLVQFALVIAKKILAPNTITGLEALEPQEFSPGLPVYVSNAGSDYHDKVTQVTESNTAIAPSVVIVRYGVKHRGYTAYLARTLLFEKSMPPLATTAYEFAVRLQAKVLTELVNGAHVASVASKCLAYAREQNQELAAKVLPVLGWTTGLLVAENKGQIGEKGTAAVEANMVFVVRIVLTDLDNGNGGKFSVEVADTVVIDAATNSAVFKTKLTRATSDITYAVAEDNDADDDVPEEPVHTRKDLASITRAGKAQVDSVSAETYRMEQLSALLSAKKNEWDQNGGKRVTTEVLDEYRTFELGRLGMGEVSCYPGGQEQPNDLPPSMLRVHRSKMAAWMPVGARAVPFHIACINKIDLKKEGSNVSMVVTFHSTQESSVAFRQHRTKVFIRELTYTTTREEKQFEEFARQVRELQTQIKNADVSRKAKQGLAAATQLKLANNPHRLRSVRMRPPPITGGKNRDVGNLELHENGLRFTFAGETLEFPFENIKHLIFQHAVKGESMTIFHITLKQPVMIGKKKTDEVQVIAELLEAFDDLEKGVRRGGDAQEEEQEEKERKLLTQTNREFMYFTEETQKRFNRSVEVCITSFTFTGVAHREMTTLRGSKNVLWAITDFPFFTLSVKDIEIAHLERVAPGNTSFDISFIPANYKAPIQVTTVATSKLGCVKDWCIVARLPYAEHGININWGQMLKVIREDKDWEPWGTEGWQTCMEDDEEDEEDDTSDSSYHESDDEDGSDDDDDDEEDDDSDASLDWDESDSEPKTESSGSEDSDEYWEKMEKSAKEHDAKAKVSDDDSDDDSDTKRKRKQRRTEAAPARPAAGKSAPARPAAPSAAKRPGGMPMKSAPPMFGKGAPARPANSMPPRPAPGAPPRR